MQARIAGFVADSNFRAVLTRQRVDCLGIAGTHVDGGQDAERNAAVLQRLELFVHDMQTGPLDESNEKIHTIGAFELLGDLASDLRLMRCIGEQSSVR